MPQIYSFEVDVSNRGGSKIPQPENYSFPRFTTGKSLLKDFVEIED